jgi:beta-galactosidase
VGVAVPDALWSFRIKRLKAMGCNAIRTSHNERAAAFLDACDRLGMLVLDETRYFGSNPQCLADLRQQVCRDRNHPCVFLWSLANEEPLHHSAADEAIAITMRNLVHKLDSTRLCTAAVYDWPTGKPYGIPAGIDVQGFNYYNQGDTDAFHKNNPDKPSLGTEEGMAQYTRGIYENTKTYLSAYDIKKPGCRNNTAEESIKYYDARPWIAGMFFWTGFDYRGEPSPFGWPNTCSDFGILDTCGFPKDVFYYLQSCWTDQPMVHLLPHWNWPGKEGQPIDVRCFSNCEEVELFLNGRSMGKKTTPKDSHLQWPVNYAPGTLAAKGYSHGKVIAEEKVETTGVPAAIRLSPDRVAIQADGEDLSIVTVSIADAQGRMVPTANNPVSFELAGPGKIIGVGNGDPISHEFDVAAPAAQAQMMPLTDWRMKVVTDSPARAEIGAGCSDDGWEKGNVQSDSGPLKPGESAVYRTHVLLGENEPAAANTVLNFGTIDDEGWVYVNGQLAGESHDWRANPSFEVGQWLLRGTNLIAVLIKNKEGSGGLNHGATLEFVPAPATAVWQRRAFNGLAQVLIQSERNSGAINLQARAAGLAGAAVTIQTEP